MIAIDIEMPELCLKTVNDEAYKCPLLGDDDCCKLQSDEQNEKHHTWEEQYAECPLIEIVECKNCKYNTSKPNSGNALCELFYGMMDQMGYCHRAERRTDE